MARIADRATPGPSAWEALARTLAARRGGLALYQWLWMILCAVGALGAAGPRVVSQPVLYFADAQARFDMSRYGGIYGPVAPNTTGLDVAFADAREALRQGALARADVRFGLPDYRVEFIPQAPGLVLARGVAGSAEEARALADAAAEELTRQVRAAGGREILRNMLGWELWMALEPQGAPAPGPFDIHLREIIRLQAFPMSRPLEPVADPRSLAALSPEERSDLTRALESRYDLWRFAVNTRNATLDALCASAGAGDTAARETALAACAAQSPAAAAELAARDTEIERLRTIEAALAYMVNSQGMAFRPDVQSAAFRVRAELPAAPQPRRIPELLALALAFGLAFGAIGVAVDRSAGVMAKLRDLWQYRELIRNLVLRDLRSRYKGSGLGYVWTQLAPLLTMMVFVFIFGFVMRSGIALFPVFVIVGLLPWNFFAEAVSGGTRSIIDNAHLIKKVYFPREVLPLVSVASSLVNYLLSLPMLFLVIIVVQLFSLGRLNLSWTIAYLPVLLIIQTVFIAGIALFLAALAVFFRDIVHLIGILLNFWFFLTPVFYSLEVFGGGLASRLIRWLNPMASLVEFYREIFYGNLVLVGQIPTPALPALSSVLRVSVTAVLVLAAGYWFFQRTSRRFGEEI